MNTIVLVDTDPLTLRLVEVSLRQAGFDVVTASHAAEALARVRGKAPDLLVTATRMPGMDGFALARTLRESAPDLPVLFLSGADATDDRARARDLDVDDVLPRPLYVRELVARVNLLLARRVQRAVTCDEARGSTAELSLADLLLSLEASHLTGVVHLEEEGQCARIHVREGNVVDAELGRLRGSDVVVRTLLWDRANFRVEPGPVDNVDLIECTTHALLLRAMDRIDGRISGPAAMEEPAPLGRESVDSTAPWTHEASRSEAPDPEVDLHAAGVPRRKARSLRRLVFAGVPAAAALVVWAALGSMHARAGHGAPTTQAASEPPAFIADAVPAAPPATVAPVATAVAPETATEPGGIPGAADAPAAAGGEGVAVASPPAAPSATAGDPHEKALDLKTQLHARSPLVRDAERALLRGDTARACALAQQAVTANPSDAEGWLTLAAAKKASGDLAAARATYEQCTSKAHTAGVMNCRVLAARSE